MTFWREVRWAFSGNRRPPGFLGRFLNRPAWPSVGPADPPIPVAEPPIVLQLLALQAEKGSPLTEAEVVACSENANCVAMPLSQARELPEKRGFHDLDPGNIWPEWQTFLADLERTGQSVG